MFLRGHWSDQKAADLARTLHEGTWFPVRGSTNAVTSRTGGRQGCKLGALIFNSVYAVALDMLHCELADAGVVLRLCVQQGAFWATPDPACDDEEDVIDATSVDDECVVFVATN